MFLDADRRHLVEGSLDGSVVGQFEGHLVFDAEALRLFPGIVDLLGGQRDAKGRDAVFLRRIAGQRAPSAADIEQAIAGLQAQFPADEFKLVAPASGRCRCASPCSSRRCRPSRDRARERRSHWTRRSGTGCSSRFPRGCHRWGFSSGVSLSGHGPPWRTNQNLRAVLKASSLLTDFADFARAHLRFLRGKVEQVAIHQVDALGNPDVRKRFHARLAQQCGDGAFIGEAHGEGIGGEVLGNLGAVPQYEAEGRSEEFRERVRAISQMSWPRPFAPMWRLHLSCLRTIPIADGKAIGLPAGPGGIAAASSPRWRLFRWCWGVRERQSVRAGGRNRKGRPRGGLWILAVKDCLPQLMSRSPLMSLAISTKASSRSSSSVAL